MRREVESREARAQRNSRWPHRSRMGHSSQRVGKPRTPGCGLKAKAPSLRKDWTKGTQRTRKLSTGNVLWSWRNGKERFVRARRGTAGAKPYTMKVVRTVFNGGHEETYGNATRLVPTQQHLCPLADVGIRP